MNIALGILAVFAALNVAGLLAVGLALLARRAWHRA